MNIRYTEVKPIKPMGMDMPMKTGPQEPKKIYPKIRIPLEALPEARKWDTGKTYEVSLKLVQKGLMDTEYEKEVTFEIHGVAVINEAKEDKKPVKRY